MSKARGAPRRGARADDPEIGGFVPDERRPRRRDEGEPKELGYRQARLERLMFEELDQLFRGEVADPVLGALVVLRVELSCDLRNARVAYVHPAPQAAEDALERALPYLRHRLVEGLAVKRAPLLRFELRPDLSVGAAQEEAPPD